MKGQGVSLLSQNENHQDAGLAGALSSVMQMH